MKGKVGEGKIERLERLAVFTARFNGGYASAGRASAVPGEKRSRQGKVL